MGKPVNLSGVRAARDAAKRVVPAKDEQQAPPKGALPEDCPVVPLGKDEGTRYYLDADCQLRALADKEHSRLGILGLFGNDHALLYKYWPRCDKNGFTTGWRPELAAEMLIGACSLKGVWDSTERERGRGAWLGENGELVLHTGSTVMSFPHTAHAWRDHQASPAGLVGYFVYSRGGAIGAPSHEAVAGGAHGAAGELLDLLATWQWRRPDIDAVLLLGWIGAAMVGGALKWRPMAWLTGDRGSGKSMLQELIKQLFAGGIIQTADSTPAGLWQALRHQTLPVAFDELEAEEDPRRAIAVVKLARTASSGALMLRGGADHKGTEFVVRSSFLFSSILIPPLTPQDRSRITVLELEDLPIGAEAPVLEAKAIGRLGAQLRRRMVDGWSRMSATLDRYQSALKNAGHTARSADQIGTLLMCADLLLYDDAEDNDGVEQWCGKFSVAEYDQSDDATRDHTRCLQHLLSATIDPHRNGGQRSVAEWIRIAAKIDDGDDAEAGRVLGRCGIKVVNDKPRVVVVANYHQGLADLYGGTHWAGRSSTQGVWVQALRRLRGASGYTKAVWFAGVVTKATAIPIDVVVPPESISSMRLPL